MVTRAFYQFGRILMALIFLYSGYNKVIDLEGTAHRLEVRGLPLPEIFALGGAALEIVGALMLGLGYRSTAGAALLVLFLIPTTLLFHPPGEKGQLVQFLKNLAILGGLFVVIGASSQHADDD